MKYTIDATGKKLGRVASEAATLLIGKNSTSFARNIAPAVTVSITNASKLSIPQAKRDNKQYLRYSGYPGGQKAQSLEQVVEKKGYSEILRIATTNMLPHNKLRAVMLKNLIITE